MPRSKMLAGDLKGSSTPHGYNASKGWTLHRHCTALHCWPRTAMPSCWLSCATESRDKDYGYHTPHQCTASCCCSHQQH